MRTLAKMWLCMACLALASACDAEQANLFVDLRTDFVPGAEFTAVRCELEGAGLRDEAGAVFGDDYVTGRRVATFRGLAPGNIAVVVRLLDPIGDVLAERRVLVTLATTFGVTVVVTRDCRDVVCPPSETPGLTSCLGGECVDPRCLDGTGTDCEPRCSTDAECTAPPAACAEARCAGGVCLSVSRVGGCPRGAWCNPMVGCVSLGGDLDGGPPVVDAGLPDGGEPELAAFDPPMFLTELNSSYDDDDPTLTADMREIFFSSARTGGAGGTDIWTATRGDTTATWDPPSFVGELSSPVDDGSPEVSGDGLTIYFVSGRAGGPGSNDVYLATRGARTDRFGMPRLVKELSTSGNEQNPTAATDVTMYLSRSALTQFDLFRATRASVTASWEAPTPIAELNTGFDEISPFLLPGGLLVFSTGRPGGPGGRDVWTARLGAGGTFEPIGPLPDIGGPLLDDDPWLPADRSVIFFMSERAGGRDLYFARRAP